MSLVLYRIDDRLIHGQVVLGWGQPLNVQFIVLVDNDVAQSDWEQELYRMGVPPGMQIYFDTVDKAVAAMAKYRADARVGILITPDILTMQKLVNAGVIACVNVGGIHHRPGRTQKLRYVFLTQQEETELREMGATGVPITAQDVPGATSVSLADILKGEGA